jgi:hypothetical protein
MSPVVLQIATQLDSATQQPGPREAKLATAQLSAAALLAVQPDAFSYSSRGLHILRALARAPLRRLTPETLRLSRFCWCWVSALPAFPWVRLRAFGFGVQDGINLNNGGFESCNVRQCLGFDKPDCCCSSLLSSSLCLQVTVESPEVLVPLLSGITNAWIWTIDKRLGLFNGHPRAVAAAAPAAGAAAAAGGHAEGRGDVVDMLAEGHGAEDGSSDDEALLQVHHGSLWLVGPQALWLGFKAIASLCGAHC